MSAAAHKYGPTLHVERNGNWWVERPHATGSDVGPAGYAHRGERLPDADVQTQVDYYRRAGFHIDDKREKVQS